MLILALIGALVGALSLSARAVPPLGGWREGGNLQPTATWLGAGVQPSGSSGRRAQQAAVAGLERRIGRRLGIDHIDVPWGSGLGWRPAWDVAQGRIPLLTIGVGGDTGEVAAGRHDAYLRSLAGQVRALGEPVFLRYAPRMDAAGAWVRSPQSFVAAWRHVHDLFAGVAARWVWTAGAAAFAGEGERADAFWPGDAYVDWIGADGYNAYGCGGQTTWRSLADLFGAFSVWGAPKGKPLMLAGTGSTEDPADPSRKARWLDEAAATLAARMPQVQAFVYVEPRGACSWPVDSSTAALDAFRRLAHDPHFLTGRLPPATTVPPTTGERPAAGARPAAPPGGAGGGSVSGLLVPSGGALWGTSMFDAAWERQLGRRFDIVHFYHQWGQSFPTEQEQALAAQGRLLLLNWKAGAPWAQIAAGAQDAQIARTATRLKALGRPLFLAFHHEPEDDTGAFGSAGDYARAFRHVHDVFERVGAGNVVWVWDMMGFVGGYGPIYDELYPGDAYVDWIAYDPYNWYGCRPGTRGRSFEEITEPFYDWTAAHHPSKPLMLAEYGLREQGPGMPSKAQWFLDELRALKSTRTRIKALVYFNTVHECDWRITSSAASASAFRQIGLDGFLNRPR
jgi:beta-mannanase